MRRGQIPAFLRSREMWAIFGLSLMCALIFGGRVLLDGGRVPAWQADLPTDGAQGQFIFAETARKLKGWDTLLHSDRLWYPAGYPFLLSEQNILDAVLLSPLVWWLGPTPALALFSFFVLFSNGLAGGWLARKIGGPGWACLSGTVLLGACPYVLGELSCGRVTQAFLVPMALTLGLAWDAAKGGWRHALLAGVALGLTGYHYWFYALFLAPGVLALVLGRAGLRQGGRALAIIAGVALLLASPAIVYVTANWVDMPGRNADASAFRWVVSLTAGLPGIGPGNLGHETRYVPHLLFLAIALSGFGWLRRPCIASSLAAALLIVVSLGESLKLGGTTVTLPYGWLIGLPGFSRFWWPTRAIGTATVILVPVLALIFARLRSRALWAGWAGLALCFLQACYLPGPVKAVAAPTGTAWSRSLPKGAVLVLPMSSEKVGRRASFMQPEHGRPLVNGNGMWDDHLWPARYRTFFEGQPLLLALLEAERGKRVVGNPDWVQTLARAGVAGVLMPREKLDGRGAPALQTALLNMLLGPPTCLEGDLDCYWELDRSQAN